VNSPQRVAVLLLPGGSPLSAQLLVELLQGANALLGETPYQPFLRSPEQFALEEGWSQVWLVAPWRLLAGSEALEQLPAQLARIAESGSLLGAVEGGALWLARAGLLAGRRACSIDWLAVPLQQQHADTIWHPGLWEMDLSPGLAPVLSCARPLALPDLVLAYLAREHGEALARQLAVRLGLSTLRARDERLLGESAAPSRLPPRLAEALTLMQANLGEPLPTDDVARLVGLSRRQLERLFKQHLDSLPSRHYLELRLQRSRELLKHSGQSVLQVALACGFSSGAHFSNAYKAAFGRTPREERSGSARAPMDFAEPLRAVS
jgi:AraC family transcriptional regulator, L-arginine-responsive activator